MREREREQRKGQRKRETQNSKQAPGTEPHVGFELTNHDVMT